MWSYILKNSLRRLTNARFHQLAGLAGLIIGFTCSAAILLQVDSELGYDKQFSRSNDIYRVILHGKMGGSEFDAAVCGAPMGGYFKTEIPEVESFTRILKIPGNILISYEEKQTYEENVLYADSLFFSVFDYDFISGDPKTCLNEPNSIVLKKSMAVKYFGNDNPIGKILKADNKTSFKVTAVVADDARLSHLNFNGLMSLSTLRNHPRYGSFMKSPFAFITSTYLLLHEGVQPAKIQPAVDRIVDKYMNEEAGEKGSSERIATMTLQPVTSIHLHSDVLHELEPNSDLTVVYIYTVVAILIVVIALINYLNIATAGTIQRGREVSIHKIAGANKRAIISQFLAETTLNIGLAIILSLALIPFIAGPVGNLMGTHQNVLKADVLACFFTAVFITGLMAGIYPAFILSAFNPLFFIRKMTAGSRGGILFRRIMVGLQFLIAILLISGSLLVYRQLNFMQSRNKGFSAGNVVVIPMREARMYTKTEELMKEFDLPAIEEVAAASAWPGNYQHRKGFQPEGFSAEDPWMMLFVDVSNNFFHLMRMKIADGRGFSATPGADSLNILVNEALVRQTGWKEGLSRTIADPADGTPDNPLTYRVVGIAGDFNFASLHESIKPLIIRNNKKNFRFLFVRLKENILPAKGIEIIKKRWEELFPDSPYEGFMLQSRLESLYEKESKTARAVSIFTLLAVFISCIGLYGLATHAAAQRNRETGIRKVLGESTGSLVGRHLENFSLPVIIASVLSIPLFWYFGSHWLEKFEYRISIDIGLIIVAFLIAITVSVVTTLGVAYHASVRNPLESIREE